MALVYLGLVANGVGRCSACGLASCPPGSPRSSLEAGVGSPLTSPAAFLLLVAFSDHGSPMQGKSCVACT